MKDEKLKNKVIHETDGSPVRTSIVLDRELYAQIAAEGIRCGKNFKQIVHEALSYWLKNNTKNNEI